MTLRILQTLIICMFAYQLYVGVPHALVMDGCFDAKYDHYPQWFRWPDERIAVTEYITNDPDGNTIGCFGKPAEDRAGALWNARYDNRVVAFGGGRLEGEQRDAGDYTGVEIWNIPDGIDYVYLHPVADLDKIEWFNTHESNMSMVMMDQWGVILKCK